MLASLPSLCGPQQTKRDFIKSLSPPQIFNNIPRKLLHKVERDLPGKWILLGIYNVLTFKASLLELEKLTNLSVEKV